jgi:hypothetical protein
MHDLRAEVRRRLVGSSIDPVREIEIIEEIGQDLEDRLAELVERGVAPAEAERRVLAQLDDHDVLRRELSRVTRRGSPPPVVAGPPSTRLASDLWHDLRYGARALVKSPAFTVVTLLSLALGIGANTGIFQLLDALHFRSLPVAAPEQLADVRIKDWNWASGGFYSWHAELTNPMWELIRDRQEGFSSVLAWGDNDVNIAPSGERRTAVGILVSGGFFQTLGVPPLLGRVFTAADDRRGCGAAGAVLSHAFWQRELGGDPGAVGKRLSVDGHEVEVLGVTPARFSGLEVGKAFDLALPICMDDLLRGEKSRLDGRHQYFLSVVGRLKPGWTLERASAQLTSISPGIFAETVPQSYAPENAEKYRAYRLGATPAARGISNLRKEYSRALYFLLATAGLVLLRCASRRPRTGARASRGRATARRGS